MAVSKEKKEEVLKELDKKFSEAKCVYFADFRGLSVSQLGKLRRELRDQQVDYKVAKKTLMKISVKNANYDDIPDDLMQGPVGAAFGYSDEITPVKVLHKFSKEFENLEILGGMISGKYMSKADAIALAQLPSREELLAKLVGSMQAPISGFHAVCSGVMRNFVYACKAVADKKGS